MTRLPVQPALNDTTVALLFLLVPLLLWAIVLTASAFFSSQDPPQPAITAHAIP